MSITERIARAISCLPADLDEIRRCGAIHRAISGLDGVIELAADGRLFAAEHKIAPGQADHLEYVRSRLEMIRHLGLRIAPEFVSLTPSDPANRHAVLLARYTACSGEALRAAEEARRPFPAEALDSFAADVRTLAEHGFAHRFVRGWHHALVSETTGTIVMDDWGALSAGEESDVTAMLWNLERMIDAERGYSAETRSSRDRS